jgi:hypothetical protein
VSKGKDKAKQQAALEARVIAPLMWWAERLGLRQAWNIQVVIVDSIKSEAAGGHDALAEVTIQMPYRRALMEVATDIRDYSDADVERCVLHELLHIVVIDFATYVHSLGRCSLGGSSDTDAIHHHVEALCDTITLALLHAKYGEDYIPITIETEVKE